jgi:hypothetical protein
MQGPVVFSDKKPKYKIFHSFDKNLFVNKLLFVYNKELQSYYFVHMYYCTEIASTREKRTR